MDDRQESSDPLTLAAEILDAFSAASVSSRAFSQLGSLSLTVTCMVIICYICAAMDDSVERSGHESVTAKWHTTSPAGAWLPAAAPCPTELPRCAAPSSIAAPCALVWRPLVAVLGAVEAVPGAMEPAPLFAPAGNRGSEALVNVLYRLTIEILWFYVAKQS